jgi:hypothetical protein
LDEVRITLVVNGGGELFGKLDMFVELADWQEAGVAGKWGGRNFDFDGSGGKKIEGKEWDRV